MKVTIPSLLFVCLLSTSISAQDIKFEKEIIDYGTIERGSEKVRTFVFTNTGKEPLIIKDIKSSCDSTVSEKPTTPILPGQKGEIKVSYNTNKAGGFYKILTIVSNAKNIAKVIKIKGIVNIALSLKKQKSFLSFTN